MTSSISSTTSTSVASFLSAPNFLRNVLRVDALSCVACGLLQVAFPEQMIQLLNLPGALLSYTGEFLLVYAAVVAFISTRNPVPRPLVEKYGRNSFSRSSAVMPQPLSATINSAVSATPGWVAI